MLGIAAGLVAGISFAGARGWQMVRPWRGSARFDAANDTSEPSQGQCTMTGYNKQDDEQEGIGKVDINAYTDICAYLCERLEAGEINLEQFADELFGPDPQITYTHWSA